MLFVRHHTAIGADAPAGEQMFNHPQERLQGRRVAIGEAQAEQIQVDRVRQVAGGKLVSRPDVQQQQAIRSLGHLA